MTRDLVGQSGLKKQTSNFQNSVCFSVCPYHERACEKFKILGIKSST